MPKEKIRLDELLVILGYTESLKKAESLILSGSVFVDNKKITKSGIKFSKDINISIKNVIHEYASRGAYKLLPIIEKFNINIKDRFCIDMGASTGGFTDVLLRKGAFNVLAIDVGYGQMIERLRNDERVRVLDRFHAKDLSWDYLIKGANYLIVMDLSFISLLSIYPYLIQLSRINRDTEFEILSLIKPQFECNPLKLQKGVLKDQNEKFRVIKKIIKYIKKENCMTMHLAESPVKGMEGNTEYFIHWKIPASESSNNS